MAEPRIVRCQYRQDPHPLDDECVNVTDVDPSVVASAAEAWAAAGNGDLIADLRRVAKLADPVPRVHPTHRPEPPGTSLLKGCTVCVVCCLIVAGARGVLLEGIRPCAGPGRVELREGV